MKRVVAVLCAVLLLSALCGCAGNDGRDGYFRLPIGGEPAQLDPQMAADPTSKEVLSLLFTGLTRVTETGEVLPAAADWTVSDDGLTYTFTLRESCWSTQSGTDWEIPVRVTAADFAFAVARLQDPAQGCPSASLAEGLAVEAVSDEQLIVRLKAPDEGLLRRLADPAFYPCNRAFFDSTGGRYGLEKDTVLCNGAFYLQAWNHGDSLLCNRNTLYYDAAACAPAAVRFVVTADAHAALLAEEVDIARVTAAEAAALGEEYTVTGTEDTVTALWFSGSDALTGDSGIRAALRDAIEWSTVSAQVTANGHVPATGYLPGGCVLSGDIPYRTRINALPFVTRDTAIDTWREAAARLGLTGAPRFELLCADTAADKLLAQQVIQSWQRNLSIYCTVTAVPETTLQRRVAAGDFQIVLCDTVCADQTAKTAFSVFTAAAHNPAGYTSAAFDALYAAAADREGVEALETQLWQDCPCVPLAFVTRYTAAAPDTAGLSLRPFGGGQTGSTYDVYAACRFD